MSCVYSIVSIKLATRFAWCWIRSSRFPATRIYSKQRMNANFNDGRLAQSERNSGTVKKTPAVGPENIFVLICPPGVAIFLLSAAVTITILPSLSVFPNILPLFPSLSLIHEYGKLDFLTLGISLFSPPQIDSVRKWCVLSAAVNSMEKSWISSVWILKFVFRASRNARLYQSRWRKRSH